MNRSNRQESPRSLGKVLDELDKDPIWEDADFLECCRAKADRMGTLVEHFTRILLRQAPYWDPPVVQHKRQRAPRKSVA